jgi:tetratricopeptide (TPR) repeat protein
MNIRITVLLIVCMSCIVHVSAEETVDEEVARRQTAVALNYCHAALHRIRRNPHKQVFVEEQQRILNNLNLNKIADPEVITLYRAVLDEISQVEVSHRERKMIGERFKQGAQRQLATSFFVIGAQVATGQVGNIIQSGANSWWDYRNQQQRRNQDTWNVDRTEYDSLMSRSSTFLDSFWKLTQKNSIPDSWLVRDQDLDQLAVVLGEKEGERRLRMLKRLERFMTCYPPYWYYTARTQQQLGRLDEAMETYRRLIEIGSGHFRQDDMLAGSLANMALIQESGNDPEATQTALRISEHSNRNWEANLVCAWVLGRHALHRKAEDLILCNLDDQLEISQSTIALVSLYYHANDRTRLAKLLEDNRVVNSVPVPGLLLCARLLGSDKLPRPASHRLALSLRAEYRPGLRSDVIVLRAAAGWKLRDARPKIAMAGFESSPSEFHRADDDDVVAEFQMDSVDANAVEHQVALTLQYPGIPPIRVSLSPAVLGVHGDSGRGLALRLGTHARIALEVDVIEVDGVRLTLNSNADDSGTVKGAAIEELEPVRS